MLDRQKLLEKAFVAASLQGRGPDAVYAELNTLESSGTLLKLDVEHWTTPEIAQMEAAMLRAADRPRERDWVKPDCLEMTLTQAPHLGQEQVEAVRLACSADGVSLIEAGAGTGKTTIAEAITMAARQSNLQLVGLAPSWIAADELSASTGIDGQAIAKWRHDLAIGTAVPLSSDTLILVDEAGMIGTADMSAILSAAKEAGAKVILLGDRRQLQSVSGASALVAVADILERTATLNGVRRQQVDWQRAASTLMARGETEAGLRAYARHGCIDLVSGEDAARTATVEKWSELRHRLGDDVLIVTRRNIDVIAINSQARLALRQEGKIAPDEFLLPSIGRDDKKREMAISVGDRVRFGEAIPRFGVRNGTVALVQAIEEDVGAETRIQLRLENGETISSRWGDFVRPRLGRQSAVPKISHAYAGTAYAAQGRTAAGTIFHVGGKTDARDIYVGLTRHRQDAHAVVESGRLDAACRLRQDDGRITPTSTAMLERLFSESRQYREKANVLDYVDGRNDFIATGKVSVSEPDNCWSIGSALRASLQLSNLARPFQTLWRIVSSVVSPELKMRTPLPEHFRTLRQDINQRHDARERDARRPHYEF
ncbi:ATP-dependent RecD-like DNA helicase [Devosia sp. Naph2]|uniref:ATP-dependent DNA helicase n=1 Tax=Devosia polycyclovorans TaxID=3345148 RepID=UPI0035CF6416